MMIKEINSKDSAIYKDFFMKGLINDENSFRISPGDELLSPFPTRDSIDSFTLGYYIDNLLTGVASFERDGATREKLRHKSTLFRMYVSAAYRGRGIARNLIVAIIERAKKLEGIEQINLTVVDSNETARKLYESIGFVTFSKEVNAIKWKNNYFTELQMVYWLKQ